MFDRVLNMAGVLRIPGFWGGLGKCWVFTSGGQTSSLKPKKLSKKLSFIVNASLPPICFKIKFHEDWARNSIRRSSFFSQLPGIKITWIIHHMILNMPGVWVYQCSEYTSILNILSVLNMPGFWIYQYSEYTRVLNLSGFWI